MGMAPSSTTSTAAPTESTTQTPSSTAASAPAPTLPATTVATSTSIPEVEVAPADQECGVCFASCSDVCNDGHQFVLYSECRDGTKHTFEGCPCEHSRCP